MKSTTGRCESDRLRRAVEQPHAKFFFQLGYRSRERGLRYGGPDCRLCETAGLRDRGEVPDLVELRMINPVYVLHQNIRFGLCVSTTKVQAIIPTRAYNRKPLTLVKSRLKPKLSPPRSRSSCTISMLMTSVLRGQTLRSSWHTALVSCLLSNRFWRV